MGFFSWHCIDSERSISNRFSVRPTFTVYMIGKDGRKFKETNYEGYGEFGGKDYYEFLAELNEINLPTREAGLERAFSGKPTIFPQLVQDPDYEFDERDWFEEPEPCEYQGFFYDDCDC